MRSLMTTGRGHRFAEHATDGVGVGITGPELFEGTVHVHTEPGPRALVVDGEAYHVCAEDGRPCRGAALWSTVHRRWITGGAEVLVRLDGVFNAVQVDASSGPTLRIFNDRYGSRRLYYAELADAFVFASEMAPIVAWMGAGAAFDPEFIRPSVCFGSPIDDATWIRGIRLFPPATVMTVSRDATTTDRYWRWSDAPPAGSHSAPDRFDALYDLWQRALAARLHGSRVGQQLSGGLDSRLILGEAVRHRQSWTTSTYGDEYSDDVRFAKRSAACVGASWSLCPLPADWLDRRLAVCVAHDGIVDLVNTHAAGLASTLAGLMDFEIGGYLGDAVLGGTGTQWTPDTVVWGLSYWMSPVSLGPEAAQTRIGASVAGTTSLWSWMFENKWRRAINAWPQLAVNDLEVRKPFLDYAFAEYCVGLPLEDRLSRRGHMELLQRSCPSLARVPWQRTGVHPGAGVMACAVIKGVRVVYRAVQPWAARAGVPMRPWVRNAFDEKACFGTADVRCTLTDCLTDRAALINEYFEREAIERTLSMAFDTREVAIEVPMNLYRAEHVLRRFRALRLEPAGERPSEP